MFGTTWVSVTAGIATIPKNIDLILINAFSLAARHTLGADQKRLEAELGIAQDFKPKTLNPKILKP